MNRLILLLFVAVTLPACAILPTGTVRLDPGAETVRVVNSVPPFDYEEIGAVFATDGSGCGALGAKGDYQNAEARLKNKAFAMGAGYVRIQSVTEPHAEEGCFRNELKIYGNAYRRRGVEPPPPPPLETEKAQKSVAEPPPAAAEGTGATVKEEADPVKKLRELKTLLDEKIISEEEYQKLKARVLETAY